MTSTAARILEHLMYSRRVCKKAIAEGVELHFQPLLRRLPDNPLLSVAPENKRASSCEHLAHNPAALQRVSFFQILYAEVRKQLGQSNSGFLRDLS